MLIDDLFSRNATITTADISRAIVGDVANAEQARSVWSGLRALAETGELIALDVPLAIAGDAGTESAGVRWTTPAMLAREAALRSAIDALAVAPPRDVITVNLVELDALGFRAAQRTAAQRILAGERLVPIEVTPASGNHTSASAYLKSSGSTRPNERKLGSLKVVKRRRSWRSRRGSAR